MIGSLVETRTIPAKRLPNPGYAIRQAIADAVKAWRIASAQRRIAIQLAALGGNVLKDIGVERERIFEAAHMLAHEGEQDRQA